MFRIHKLFSDMFNELSTLCDRAHTRTQTLLENSIKEAVVIIVFSLDLPTSRSEKCLTVPQELRHRHHY